MKACVVIAVVVALLRPTMLFVDYPELAINVYKDFSHLFIGGLVGVWFLQPTTKCEFMFLFDLLFGFFESTTCWQMRLASVLTWVEIICFGLSRTL